MRILCWSSHMTKCLSGSVMPLSCFNAYPVLVKSSDKVPLRKRDAAVVFYCLSCVGQVFWLSASQEACCRCHVLMRNPVLVNKAILAGKQWESKTHPSPHPKIFLVNWAPGGLIDNFIEGLKNAIDILNYCISSIKPPCLLSPPL